MATVYIDLKTWGSAGSFYTANSRKLATEPDTVDRPNQALVKDLIHIMDCDPDTPLYKRAWKVQDRLSKEGVDVVIRYANY